MNQRGTLFVLAANPEVALARADILLFGLSLASVEKRSESDGGVDVCLWKVFGRRAWHEIFTITKSVAGEDQLPGLCMMHMLREAEPALFNLLN